MAELFSLTSLYILLGVIAVLGAVFWAVRRAIGAGSAKEAVIHGHGKREALLNKDAVALVVPEPVVDSGDTQLCAICQGRLAGAGMDDGPCRRLRPCGHVYHAECIDLWLERRRICPLCRARVVVSRTETVDAMV